MQNKLINYNPHHAVVRGKSRDTEVFIVKEKKKKWC